MVSPLLSGIQIQEYKPSPPPSTSSSVSTPLSNSISPSSPFGSTQTSTPQQGGIDFSGLQSLNPFNYEKFGQPKTPSIAPTSSGGIAFDPSHASGFNTPFKVTSASNGTQSSTQPDLNSFINNSYQTPNGGTINTKGDGSIAGFQPANGFNIDTSGATPSSALSSNTSSNDIQQKHSQYQDYVNGLAQAQGYSPEYIQALQQQQKTQLEGANYNLNAAALNSNFYTGNNLPGDTLNYAQGATAKAQAQNTLGQAQNSIQQLSANQQMEVQALMRSGNIAAAQSLVQAYQPVSVSPGNSLVSPGNGQQVYNGVGGLVGVNSINSVNSLGNQYPDAGILPTDSLDVARQKVSSSPSFQGNTPTGKSDIASLTTQQSYLDTTTRAYQTATSNLGTLQTFMQQNGINDANVPIINQIQNKIKGKVLDPGVVAAFTSSLEGLRAEYAQVLSRGGSVTDTERKTANALIPDNLNPQQLKTVTNQLSLEGQNAVNESQKQVDTIKGRLSGQTQSSPSSSSDNGWY